MKIVIDGMATLLGQTIAELAQAQFTVQESLVSIMHGSVATLKDDEDEQISTDKDIAVKHEFLQDLEFSENDIVFVADNQEHNQLTIAQAVQQGAMVIDCAGNTVGQVQVPIIVHDINSHELQGLRPGFVIATPTAGATMLSQIIVALLQNQAVLQSINVCHFVPAAHFGKSGVELLASQTARLLNGMPLSKKQGLEQIAFNLLPQAGAIGEGDFTELETQIMNETRRVLNDDTFGINASCVQVPVFYAQSQVIDAHFSGEVDLREIESALKQRAGISIGVAKKASPVAIHKQDGQDDIVVSRLRQNQEDKRSLTLWCVSDNLRRGAAGNAVQIADLLIKSYL